MNTKVYLQILHDYILAKQPNLGDGDSVLTMLYECYSDSNMMDDGRIKTDFNELYHAMNGMSLREMDKIIYPVCMLCRDHQRSGFVEGVRIGVRLTQELKEKA